MPINYRNIKHNLKKGRIEETEVLLNEDDTSLPATFSYASSSERLFTKIGDQLIEVNYTPSPTIPSSAPTPPVINFENTSGNPITYIEESNTLRVRVTSSLADGSVANYTISGISETDILGNLTGTLTFTGGEAILDISVVNDATTETPENLTFTVSGVSKTIEVRDNFWSPIQGVIEDPFPADGAVSQGIGTITKLIGNNLIGFNKINTESFYIGDPVGFLVMNDRSTGTWGKELNSQNNTNSAFRASGNDIVGDDSIIISSDTYQNTIYYTRKISGNWTTAQAFYHPDQSTNYDWPGFTMGWHNNKLAVHYSWGQPDQYAPDLINYKGGVTIWSYDSTQGLGNEFTKQQDIYKLGATSSNDRIRWVEMTTNGDVLICRQGTNPSAIYYIEVWRESAGNYNLVQTIDIATNTEDRYVPVRCGVYNGTFGVKVWDEIFGSGAWKHKFYKYNTTTTNYELKKTFLPDGDEFNRAIRNYGLSAYWDEIRGVYIIGDGFDSTNATYSGAIKVLDDSSTPAVKKVFLGPADNNAGLGYTFVYDGRYIISAALSVITSGVPYDPLETSKIMVVDLGE